MTIYDHVQTVIQPVLVDLLMTVILGALAWLGRHVPAWMRLRIDQINRQALHSALETGAALALDTIQLIPGVAVSDAAVTRVVAYVRRSVPGALRHFLPTDTQLADMARAKLSEALIRRSPDALDRALSEAMGEAVGAAVEAQTG